MKVAVGTSGFAYKAWRGSFYPEDLKEADFLSFYSGRLGAVEINNTFYRMPKPALLADWSAKVPAGFIFVLKAPQRITHIKRLKDAAEDVAYFVETSGTLGVRQGPTLFQLPPNLKADLPRLDAFLALLPGGWRAAFEFRHPSWFTDETYGLLRARGAALVWAETDDDEKGPALEVPRIATADWGYLRLRRAAYSEGDIRDWAARTLAQPWRDAFVFFKHEEAGTGPRLAAEFIRTLGGSA